MIIRVNGVKALGVSTGPLDRSSYNLSLIYFTQPSDALLWVKFSFLVVP